ncbi:MAG TPA: HD domain-containing phosphohydrolase [Capsulimonadaceae bacterium]|jgi:diguanylate cyclase (GGDEF)-like protein/PAS domain S-box-containing protein
MNHRHTIEEIISPNNEAIVGATDPGDEIDSVDALQGKNFRSVDFRNLENFPDAFLAIDSSWRVTFANKRALSLFGVSSDDLIDHILWDVVPELVGHPFYEADHEAVATKTAAQVEAYYAPLGMWLEKRIYPAGSGIITFLRDITQNKMAAEVIRTSEAKYRRLAESGVIGINVWDYDGKITWANETFLSMTGYTLDDVANGLISTHDLTPDDWQWTSDKIYKLLRERGQFHTFQKEYYRKDRTRVPVLVGGALLDDGENGISFVIDMTEQRRVEAALRESEYRLRFALQTGRLGSVHVDLKTGEILEATETFRDHIGVPTNAFLDDAVYFQTIHPDDRARVRETRAASIAQHVEYDVEFRCVWPDSTIHWLTAHGCPIYNDDGEAVRLVGVTQDITERKLQETHARIVLQEAQDRADRDPLTDLYNHRAFHNRYISASSRALSDGARLAVVMLDLDNFKFFNDVYGHAVGDEVLIQVAERLRAACRRGDTLSRFGGDEFAVLIADVGAAREEDIAARLQSALNGMAYLPSDSNTSIPITASLGIAFLPGDSTDRAEVLRIADERLRRAKSGESSDTEADQIRKAVTSSIEGFSMLDALVTAVDNKDRYTRKHSEDVMTNCLLIARAMNLTAEEVQDIGVAALLHDVGKIGVPDAILRKPGRLTDAEYAAVKQHPEMGAIMVSAVPGLEETLNAIRYHHERWDGKGYPEGLSKIHTPLSARLMAVADAYSAMTTDRPYRQGMSVGTALDILEKGAGTQWDPEIVAVFLAAKREAVC